MNGVGTVGNITYVKYCSDATIDLITISKLGEIGFRVSFEDEKGQVRIRKIRVMSSKEQFLYLAHVHLSLRTAGKFYPSKSSLNLSSEN